MAVGIGSNIASLMAQRQLSKASDSLAESSTRLSSGLRINGAKDDAAGLAIASTLGAHARIFTQGVRNVNDAISYLNVAEGATQQFSSILERMKELAESAANGTLSLTQRRSLDKEAFELQKEYNRIVQSTRFNNINILDGSVRELVTQAGIGTAAALQFNITENLSQAAGSGSTTSSTNLAGTASYRSMVSGDFNGDGKADLFVAGSIYIGNGNGTFKAPSVLTGYTAATSSVEGADLNNDGRMDIVERNNVGQIKTYLSNGDGTFGAQIAASSGFSAFFGVQDVNSDGILDMVGPAGASLRVALGNGDGTFATGKNTATGALSGAVYSDFNGDGKIDVAGFATGTAVNIFYGGGDGSFVSGGSVNVTTSGSLGAADLDHDGLNDLVVDTGAGAQILLNNGDSTFRTGQLISGVVPYADKFNFADINADGNLDIISANTSSAGTSVVLGNGDGTFGARINNSNVTNRSVVIGDFNGDGVPDIAGCSGTGFGVDIGISNTTQTTNFARIDLLTRQSALSSMAVIDAALQRVNSQNGAMGALQVRLESASRTLESSSLNYEAARGRIVSADVASEAANLMRSNILQQTAAAILAQANQTPALALSLLRG